MSVAFRTAAERFRLIDEDGESIVVPYLPEDANESPIHMWLAVLAKDANTTWARRKLQRYSVNVPRPQFERGTIRARDGTRHHGGLFFTQRSIYCPG